jgi:hypothetical protein
MVHWQLIFYTPENNIDTNTKSLMEVVMLRFRSVVTLFLIGLFASFPVAVQAASDAVAGAVLPLPADLRADATVFTYDADSGERVVLKAGSNHVECRPLDEESGFTRCYPTNSMARRDLSARLSAQGVEGEELQSAMALAERSGTIKPRVFGSISYRHYNKPDRIQLLMVVSVPNATAEQLGMTTGSQRDNSLAGMGRPWMMRAGTPGAHIMVPINGTELSNQP